MFLKQSLLAVAVSVASINFANAASLVLDGSPVDVKPLYDEALTLSGSQVNSAAGVVLFDTEIHGDLTNLATINATGAESTGLLIRDAIIGDQYVYVHDFTGDIINKGSVTANGHGSTGLNVMGGFAGSFSNEAAGKIIAVGDDSTGLHFNGANMTGKILNDGLISGGNVGLDLDSSPDESTVSTMRGIDNAGIIEGTGAQSTGILIDGVTVYENERGLVNTGTIKGGAIGIDFDQFTMTIDPTDYTSDPKYEKTHFQVLAEKGEISAGQYAIKGADRRVDLTWGNNEGRGTSTIRGDLQGLALTKVIGPAEFFGNTIQSQEVRLETGSSLNLNNAHTTIDGDLNVQSGASLGLPLSAETLADTPVLKVTGTANLANGSTVVINAKGSDFAKGGATYDLISASSLNISSDVQIKSSSALLGVNGVTIENGKLNVKVSSVGDEETGTVIENGGGNANTQGATKSFISVAELLGATNPNDLVLKALLAAGSDEKAIAAVAKQLTPEVNGGAASAANSSLTLVSNAISTRSSELRAGESSGEALVGTGAWFQILNSNASQNMRSGIDGYDADSNGFAIGADKKLNDSTLLGVAYSYVKTDVDSDTGNKTEVENHNLTAYGSWTEGNYFVDGGLSYGKGKNESKRYVVRTTAKGDYDSDMIGLNVMAGYGFHFDNGILVEPRLAARYSNLSIDGFTEKDSSAALKTGDQRLEVGDIGAGARVAGSFDLGRGTLEPEVKLMGYHDVIGDKSSTTSAFVLGGNAFVTNGASPARDSYEAGIGANYKLGAVTVGASYDRLMKTGFDADVFTAKVRYDF